MKLFGGNKMTNQELRKEAKSLNDSAKRFFKQDYYWEEIKDTGHSKIFQDPDNPFRMLEIFWNGERVWREIGKEPIHEPY